MDKITAAMFVGVNVGYKQGIAVSEPNAAKTEVEKRIISMKRSGRALKIRILCTLD